MRAEDTTATSYSDYRGVLRGQWKVIVAALLVGLLAGLAVMIFRPAVYTASASVLVLPVDTSGSGGSSSGSSDDQSTSSSSINLDTESQLVTSTAVVDIARNTMNSSLSSTDLAESVSVTVSPNSSVLIIDFHGSSPEEAARGAHYFALAYLSNRQAVAQAEIDDQVKRLKSQLSDLNKKLQVASGRVATLPANSADWQYASSQQSVLSDQISAVNEPLSKLESTAVTPGRVLTDATLPGGADQPAPPVFPIAGALLGLVAGVALAVLRDRGDHSVRNARDVGQLLRPIPVLADLDLGTGPRNWREMLDSHSAPTQEIRQLQQAVVTAADERPGVVLVTGATGGAATAVVAANLALSLARTDRTVAYVGADLFSPAGAQLLAVGRAPGLADVLLNGSRLETVLQPSPLAERVLVLAPGSDGSRADDRLQLERVREILDELRGRFDHVVVEAPPASTEASAQIWASQSDVAVIVVERHHAQREAVVGAVGKLERVGCPTVGTAVVSARPKDGAKDRDAAPAGRVGRAADEQVADPDRTATLRRARRGQNGDQAGPGRHGDPRDQRGADDTVTYDASGYGIDEQAGHVEPGAPGGGSGGSGGTAPRTGSTAVATTTTTGAADPASPATSGATSDDTGIDTGASGTGERAERTEDAGDGADENGTAAGDTADTDTADTDSGDPDGTGTNGTDEDTAGNGRSRPFAFGNGSRGRSRR